MTVLVSRRVLPLLVIGAGLVALLLLWALQPGGTSPRDEGRIFGIIEYTVQDASGNLKEHRVIRNTTTSNLLEAVESRVGTTAQTVAANDLVDNIELCQAPAIPDGTVCTTLSANLDGNPKSGTATTTSGGDTSGWSVPITFTATGASIIEGMHLTMGAVSSGMAATAANLVAYQNTSVVLASGDTLTVTWTVDID